MSTTWKPYPDYKDSGVSWLGEVPAHWQVQPGFSVYRPKQQKNVGMKETTVLSLSYGRIVIKPEDKLHGLVPASFETYQIIEPGDIIIRPTDLQNDKTSLRVGIAHDRGIITSAYLSLRVADPIIPEYGYLLLHTYDLKKIFYGMGSGLRQNLDFTDLKRIPVLAPSHQEQERIVAFLGHVDRQVNRFIHAKRRLIALLNEHKQAIIHHAVTHGLEPNVRRKPSGVAWLGDVPQHWKVLPLKRALLRLIDTEHKTAPAVEGGRYMVVRTTNIKYGQLITNKAYYTDEAGFREWTRRGVPQPGDILFTREAPAGEACIVPEGVNLCMGQRVVLMRPKPQWMEPRFLLLLIQYGAIREFIWLMSQGSTVPHFNMSDIAAMPVLVPPLEEQLEIIERCHEQTRELDATVDRTQHEIDLIREYRTRLIADVVTGKLDVRDVKLPTVNEMGTLDEPLVDDTIEEGEELDLVKEGVYAND